MSRCIHINIQLPLITQQEEWKSWSKLSLSESIVDESNAWIFLFPRDQIKKSIKKHVGQSSNCEKNNINI